MARLLAVVTLLLIPAIPSKDPHPVPHRILWTWDTWISDYDADGKRRIDAILQVLEEYRIICTQAVADVSATRSKLAELYEKAGLPDDIYQYRKWTK